MHALKRMAKSLLARAGYRIVKGARNPLLEDPFCALASLCKKTNPSIFDVGAHYGYTSLRFHNEFPTATIQAFEPFLESFKALEELTRDVPEIHRHNIALSDRSGTALFHGNKSSATNSLLETHPDGPRTWGAGLVETLDVVEIQCATLDGFMQQRSIAAVDILKLDVQGAEPLVMNGASEALSQGRISIILTEIITQPTYIGQQSFADAVSMYFNAGFVLHSLYEPAYTSDGRLSQIDAIFTHTNLSV